MKNEKKKCFLAHQIEPTRTIQIPSDSPFIIIRSFFSHVAAPKYETAYACEEKTLTIGCEPGYVINLIRANYGRFSITICNDQGNVDWSVNCMSAKSLRVLYAKCSHKQNCSILASTNTFGDPCPGTHKYLEAHYQCVSGKKLTRFLCTNIRDSVLAHFFLSRCRLFFFL